MRPLLAALLLAAVLCQGCQSTRPRNNLAYWPGKKTVASRTVKWGASNRNNIR